MHSCPPLAGVGGGICTCIIMAYPSAAFLTCMAVSSPPVLGGAGVVIDSYAASGRAIRS